VIERPAPPPAVVLPTWAVVSDKRRAHIGRVCALLDQWAIAFALDARERQAWHDAGRWHDAVRDADESTLRTMSADPVRPVGLLHGPAAAARLAAEGELRHEVLDAVRWHTTGSAAWGQLGRALFMADFLEPGRSFAQADRAYLAARVPDDFDGTFRQVVRLRLEWSLREGKSLYPETVSLWNAVR
jgi:2-amino-4-hydroxy-6-hydroxymethyldihydropteridine diphosphokinase